MNKYKWILLVLLTSAIGYFISISNKPNKNQSLSLIQKSNVTAPTSSPNRPLGFLVILETAKGKLVIHLDQEFITLNPFDGPGVGQRVSIEKENYPKLFAQGIGNFSTFRAENYEDPMSKRIYIKLSNNQPDHGSYSEVYSILVDPITGEIIEKNDNSKSKIDSR